MRLHKALLMHVIIAAAVAAVCSIVFGAFYPGISSPDMTIEYIGMHRGIYSDWHPPMMAFLWKAIEVIIPGKPGLFIVFTGTYAACVFVLLLCALRVSALAAALVCIVVVYPCFMTQGTNLVKDFLMALFLGFSVGVTFLAQSTIKPSRGGLLILAFSGTLMAVLLRTNAVFGASPVFLYLSGRNWTAKPLRFILISGLCAGLLIPVTDLVNEIAFHPKKLSVIHSLYIFDFAGITHFSGVNVFPPEVRRSFTTTENEACYSPQWWDPFLDARDFFKERLGTSEEPDVAYTADPKLGACQNVWRVMRQYAVEHGRSFTRDWVAAIAGHPIAYALHRLSHFNESLEWLTASSRTVIRTDGQNNPFGWSFKPNRLSQLVMTLANAIGSLPIAWPFVWLTVAFATFLTSQSIHDPELRSFLVALTWSGTFYTIGLLVVGIASDYRYHVWLLLSAGVAAALALADAFRHGTLKSLLVRYTCWLIPSVAPACAWRLWKLPAPYLLHW